MSNEGKDGARKAATEKLGQPTPEQERHIKSKYVLNSFLKVGIKVAGKGKAV